MSRARNAAPAAPPRPPASTGSSAERSLRLLALLADAGRPLSLADLGGAPRRCRRAPRTASACSCSRAAILARDADERLFGVGPALRRLAFSTLNHGVVRGLRHDVLAQLVETIGETCNFTTQDGTEVLYLDRVEAKWPLRLTLDVGSHVPLHCTASGKLFLAMMPADEREAVIERIALPRMTRADDRHEEGAARRVRGDRRGRPFVRPRGVHRRPDRRRGAGRSAGRSGAGRDRGARADRAHVAEAGAREAGGAEGGRGEDARAGLKRGVATRVPSTRAIDVLGFSRLQGDRAGPETAAHEIEYIAPRPGARAPARTRDPVAPAPARQPSLHRHG